ncbi:MAG: hypothetical protein JRM74_04950 [Nitrososphaerota archaeon]|nr:hypothetical protein [Nitrososphaerota archaeon]
MVDGLTVLDGGAGLLSGALALMIAWKGASAYSLTGRAHLVNFASGFGVLALSYVGFALALFLVPGNGFSGPVMASVELLGFALVATSYLRREGKGSAALLLGGLGLAAVAAVASDAFMADFSASAVGPIHLVEMVFALFAAVQVTRTYTEKIVPEGMFVVAGFGALAVAQYTWMIWSYFPHALVAMLATAVRILGLALLVAGLER